MQTDNKTRGGKRENAGRKSSGKQTVVVRVDAELLPIIEQIKQNGFDSCNSNQDAIERLKSENTKLLEVNTLREQERDSARLQLKQLQAEQPNMIELKAENHALREQLKRSKIFCQCLTAKGMQCTKKPSHEIKQGGFILWVCEQHYKALS